MNPQEESNHQGTTVFSHCFHLPGCHVGYPFLTDPQPHQFKCAPCLACQVGQTGRLPGEGLGQSEARCLDGTPRQLTPMRQSPMDTQGGLFLKLPPPFDWFERQNDTGQPCLRGRFLLRQTLPRGWIVVPGPLYTRIYVRPLVCSLSMTQIGFPFPSPTHDPDSAPLKRDSLSTVPCRALGVCKGRIGVLRSLFLGRRTAEAHIVGVPIFRETPILYVSFFFSWYPVSGVGFKGNNRGT